MPPSKPRGYHAHRFVGAAPQEPRGRNQRDLLLIGQTSNCSCDGIIAFVYRRALFRLPVLSAHIPESGSIDRNEHRHCSSRIGCRVLPIKRGDLFGTKMRGFAFLICLVGCFAILAAYANTRAQSRPVAWRSCETGPGTVCQSSSAAANSIAVCLRAQSGESETCLIAFSPIALTQRPQTWSQLLLRPKVN